jgi:hypothetical protein
LALWIIGNTQQIRSSQRYKILQMILFRHLKFQQFHKIQKNR